MRQAEPTNRYMLLSKEHSKAQIELVRHLGILAEHARPQETIFNGPQQIGPGPVNEVHQPAAIAAWESIVIVLGNELKNAKVVSIRIVETEGPVPLQFFRLTEF